MNLLEQFPILQEIERDLNTVTDAAVRHASSKLGEVEQGEKTLGTVHRVEAQKLFVLSRRYKCEVAKAAAAASTAESDEEEKEHHDSAHRYDNLHDLCMELFWNQVREDISSHCIPVGVRNGWMAVERPDTNSGPGIGHIIARLGAQ